MPNNPRLPDPDLRDRDAPIWQWLCAKCKLTWGSTLIWLVPMVTAFIFEDGWRWVAAICIPIGIGLSHGRWRRFLGVAFWIGIVFWGRRWGADGTGIVPGPVGFLWLGGFFLTAFADREKWKREQEEEWG